MNPERLETLLENFAGQRLAVIGDLMLDRYVWGRASRISQEAPVPIVAVDRTTAAPGGAANVLRNLAELGAEPIPYGVVGDDAAGTELCALMDAFCGEMSGVITDPHKPTTEKTRVFAGNQQVVRVDREASAEIPEDGTKRLTEALQQACKEGRINGIVIEDYGKGCVTHALVSAVVACGQKYDLPVTMDPHPAHGHNVKGLTLLTPNRAEAFALAGAYYTAAPEGDAEDTALERVVETLHKNWGAKYLLVTLGSRGMALYEHGKRALRAPTKAREVYDVSGAGDTVIATFTLALLAGATPEEGATLANHAAGVVVGKVGTAPVTVAELRETFDDGTP